MPLGDGTGPQGRGPLTGRMLGWCARPVRRSGTDPQGRELLWALLGLGLLVGNYLWGLRRQDGDAPV